MSEELKAALARIACLEGEIAKRDARIVELESQYQRDVYGLNNEGDPIGGDPAGGYANDNARLRTELAAIKAQEPVEYQQWSRYENWDRVDKAVFELGLLSSTPERFRALYAAPVSEAKAQDTVGEVVGWYRLDRPYEMTSYPSVCATWHRLGAPVAPLYAAPVSEDKAQGVVQWPEADEIMQMAFEEGHPADDASGYYFELEEFDLFIERLMSEVARLNAAPVQQPKCKTCDDNGRIGGPSFYAPDEGGEPCPDCSAPVQQVSVPDGFCIGAWRDALEKIAKYAPQVNCAARTELERAGLIAVHALIAFSAPQFRHARGTQMASNAAPAAPAADANHVFFGMDGNHP